MLHLKLTATFGMARDLWKHQVGRQHSGGKGVCLVVVVIHSVAVHHAATPHDTPANMVSSFPGCTEEPCRKHASRFGCSHIEASSIMEQHLVWLGSKTIRQAPRAYQP